jgi:hypothetical protein
VIYELLCFTACGSVAFVVWLEPFLSYRSRGWEHGKLAKSGTCQQMMDSTLGAFAQGCRTNKQRHRQMRRKASGMCDMRVLNFKNCSAFSRRLHQRVTIGACGPVTVVCGFQRKSSRKLVQLISPDISDTPDKSSWGSGVCLRSRVCRSCPSNLQIQVLLGVDGRTEKCSERRKPTCAHHINPHGRVIVTIQAFMLSLAAE